MTTNKLYLGPVSLPDNCRNSDVANANIESELTGVCIDNWNTPPLAMGALRQNPTYSCHASFIVYEDDDNDDDDDDDDAKTAHDLLSSGTLVLGLGLGNEGQVLGLGLGFGLVLGLEISRPRTTSRTSKM